VSFVGHGWRSGTATDPGVNTGAASTATVSGIAPTTFAVKNRITLTVTGTGFTAQTVIYAGYSPIPTTFDSATQLRCTSFPTTPDSGTLIPIGVKKPSEKMSNTVLFTATGSVQGFSVLAVQQTPTTFLFNTDETSEHTNLWDFGDGTSTQAPVGEEVFHRYTVAGNYTVTCKCHGITESTAVVVPVNDPHRNVVIVINGLTADVQVANGTPNRQVTIAWGDGQESGMTLDGTGAGSTSHVYAALGTYHVVARDTLNPTLTDEYDLVVPGNVQTQRVITYGCYGLNFEFLLLTIDYAQIHGEAVSWDFGDGVTADSAVSDVAVAHTFAAPGEYTIHCVFSGGIEQVTISAAEVTP
jgi:plastocyanin